MNLRKLEKVLQGKKGYIYIARKGTATVYVLPDNTYMVVNGTVTVNPVPGFWKYSVDWSGSFSDYMIVRMIPGPGRLAPVKTNPLVPITAELMEILTNFKEVC